MPSPQTKCFHAVLAILATLARRIEKHWTLEMHRQNQLELLHGLGKAGQNLWVANNFRWSGLNGIEVGDNVRINLNSQIQGEGGVKIGDRVSIGPNVTIWSVNHDIYGEKLPHGSRKLPKEVNIERNVWIGINVTIAPGTTIGEGAVVAAGTVVSGKVPAFAIIAGQKWRQIGERDRAHYARILQSESIESRVND